MLNNPYSPDAGEAPAIRRESELREAFFEGTLAEKEARELLEIWAKYPRLKAEAKGNYDVESLFQFLAHSKTPLFPDRLEELKKSVEKRDGLFPGPTTGFVADPLGASESFVRSSAPHPATRPPATEYAELPSIPPEPLRPSARRAPGKENDPGGRPFLPLPVIALVFLVSFGILIYLEWNPASNGEIGDPRSTAYAPPAVLVGSDDVRWAEGIRPPRWGEPISPGPLRFESGAVELLFFSGVRAVVEGPADLLLLHEKQVFCREGHWSVTVPEQGKGFEVQTPYLTVRDLGTRFFASVGKDRCEVRVLEGLVETEKPGGEKIQFRERQGAVFQGGESFSRLADAFDVSRFITQGEMRRRSDVFLARRGHGGTADKAETPAVRTLDFSREPVLDAEVQGQSRTEGNEPGSTAFQFAEKTDRIRIKPVGKLPAMTAVITMRIDRLNSEMNPILMSEGTAKNGLVWHLLPNGQFVVGVRQQTSRNSGISRTPVVFTRDMLTRWVDLALVFDGRRKQLAFYLNGDPVFRTTLPRESSLDLNRLDAGSWVPQSGGNWAVDGAVRRVVIFDRALDTDEIRLLQPLQ